MPLSVARVRHCLQTFDFKTLFIQELGWDRYSASLPLAVDGGTVVLQALAEKRGMQVFECRAAAPGSLPDYALRRKIERQAARSAHEHIIIYTDVDRTVQTWQWVRREYGRPLACREHSFQPSHSGDALIQKLQQLAFDIADEEILNLVDVTRRARQAFDVDRVTKRFYEGFQKEHREFLALIRGIVAQVDREWYASVMLNRLMFVYFIQKQGFLDNDLQYLQNRLERMLRQRGPGQFHTFYRHFLRRLFHEGLGRPKAKRAAGLDRLLGDVPYLNGGIFDPHELEVANAEIDIPDVAFERLLAFFDRYQWHLDTRPLAAENEINPDVLGYIFERYINQKQMGAYYTKEDITEYIARSTIVPFLLDSVALECPDTLRSGGPVWRLLRDDPDRYLFEAVRRGTDCDLPAEIAAGLDNVIRRDGWNRPAADGFALPTETWREHVTRRRRCDELRRNLRAGEVSAVNDLVADNLDLRQIAEDAIDACDSPEFLRAVWAALRRVSVLDPTCGSGAFLFAALNVLEPLYDACLARMEAMLWEARRPEEFGDFMATLEEIKDHPNRRFFILKSIIVNNLYGVDVMKEATEICKLRLLLKVIAQARTPADLEPLPDMDFNVRVGNTLVGFATLEEVETSQKDTLGFDSEDVERIRTAAKEADHAFQRFQGLQTADDPEHEAVAAAKGDLRRRLDALRAQLDSYLAADYGIDSTKPTSLAAWRGSHQPFHWFSEFFGIMATGGFDLIVGNPPYVEYGKVRRDYRIRNYATEDCGNLYAFVVERNAALIQTQGRSGMIVPHSAFCTDRMAPLLNLFRGERTTWVSTYDIRPSKLFVGVDQRLAIYLTAPSPQRQSYGTRYHRWHEPARPTLFRALRYADVSGIEYPNALAKAQCATELGLWEKLKGRKRLLGDLGGHATVYYHNAPRYWVWALTFAPYFCNERDGEKLSTQVKRLPVGSRTDAGVVAAALNSTLFYWWFILFSDSRHLNMREIERFPLDLAEMGKDNKRDLEQLCGRLMADYRRHAGRKECRYKATGKVVYDEYKPRYSKPIIDEIDRLLAKHYGFTDEELDFIINYDIKYRMGQEAEGDADE